jgi:glycosyltransferase involved in cell wall biosynthesis
MSSHPISSNNHLTKVSVVIPTFNHADFLRTAIQSVMDQTYANWELIIVNNFSTDNTIEVVAEFNDPRIQLINYRNHGVIAASRNEGVRLATGSVVAFLDSDDHWFPHKLAKCVELIDQGNDVVCHGENWSSEGLPIRAVYYGPAKNSTPKKLLFRGNCISTSATIVRASVLNEVGGFSENSEFITAEDYELWIKLAKATGKFYFIHEILGVFRRHDQSASSAVKRHLDAELSVIDHHSSQNMHSLGNYLRLRQRRSKAIYAAGRAEMRAHNKLTASRYFVKALNQSPFFLRTYIALIMLLRPNSGIPS